MQMRQVLLGAVVLAAVSFVFSGQSGFFPGIPGNLVTNLWVPGQPGFDYYKLSLTWPPSACYPTPPRGPCVLTPPEMLTIHGLWPQRAGDVGVSPYGDDPTCTTRTPTPADDLAVSLVSIPPAQLTTNWPNLFAIPNETTDLDFWKMEWRRHGMCSDYPDDPATYFKTALALHQNFFDLQTVLGITVGQPYKAGDILEKVKAKFNVYPQIACNNRVGNNAQLWEIRFCYARAMPRTTLQDCPCRLSVCDYRTQIVLR